MLLRRRSKVELFRTDTQIFSGGNCGLEYVHDPDHMREIPAKNPGGRLTFVRSWEDGPGLKAVTVETGKGNLYFQFSTEYDHEPAKNSKHPAAQVRDYYVDYDKLLRPEGDKIENGIWHAASYDNVNSLKPGEVVIYSLMDHSVEYPRHLETYKKSFEKVVNKVGFKCLYQSEPFFNWVHSERHYPSIVIIVLEKL
jgi:hypothetical protein